MEGLMWIGLIGLTIYWYGFRTRADRDEFRERINRSNKAVAHTGLGLMWKLIRGRM